MKSLEDQKYQLNKKKMQAIFGKKKYYGSLTLKGEQKIQEYYQKKLGRALQVIENRYKKKEDILLASRQLYQLENKKSTDKTKTKLGQKKEEKLKIKLEKIKNKKTVKKETRQKVFDKAKKTKQKKRVMEEKAKGKGYCRTCGSTKCLQGGHVVKAQRHPTALLDINIHPQCYHCNIGLDGNQGEYFAWFVKEYGQEKLDWLRGESKQGVKPSIERMKEEIKKDLSIIQKLNAPKKEK